MSLGQREKLDSRRHAEARSTGPWSTASACRPRCRRPSLVDVTRGCPEVSIVAAYRPEAGLLDLFALFHAVRSAEAGRVPGGAPARWASATGTPAFPSERRPARTVLSRGPALDNARWPLLMGRSSSYSDKAGNRAIAPPLSERRRLKPCQCSSASQEGGLKAPPLGSARDTRGSSAQSRVRANEIVLHANTAAAARIPPAESQSPRIFCDSRPKRGIWNGNRLTYHPSTWSRCLAALTPGASPGTWRCGQSGTATDAKR